MGNDKVSNPAPQRIDPPPTNAIYARAATQFSSADFFKPAESKEADIVSKLAPLLIHERLANTAADTRFGAVRVTNGIVSLDLAHPTIYFDSDTTQIRGQLFARFSYFWCYPATAAGANSGKSVQFQGVRITLNSAGQPIIWEALFDETGFDLIFTAQSVELAARAKFGQPLPDRRFAVERGLNEAPNTLVARVIEDGPMPMGPIVYLKAPSHSVNTLICRCMPSQAKELKTTTEYELKPLRALPQGLSLPQTAPIEGRGRWDAMTDLRP